MSSKQDGWTALHIAAQKGSIDLCRVLLDGGANKDAKAAVSC